MFFTPWTPQPTMTLSWRREVSPEEAEPNTWPAPLCLEWNRKVLKSLRESSEFPNSCCLLFANTSQGVWQGPRPTSQQNSLPERRSVCLQSFPNLPTVVCDVTECSASDVSARRRRTEPDRSICRAMNYGSRMPLFSFTWCCGHLADHMTGRDCTRSSECYTHHVFPRYYHGGAQADESSLSSSVSCFDFSLSFTHSEMLIDGGCRVTVIGFVWCRSEQCIMNRIPAISDKSLF